MGRQPAIHGSQIYTPKMSFAAKFFFLSPAFTLKEKFGKRRFIFSMSSLCSCCCHYSCCRFCLVLSGIMFLFSRPIEFTSFIFKTFDTPRKPRSFRGRLPRPKGREERWWGGVERRIWEGEGRKGKGRQQAQCFLPYRLMSVGLLSCFCSSFIIIKVYLRNLLFLASLEGWCSSFPISSSFGRHKSGLE
ncbi:hypothetical protein F5X99DRAFT_38085 [Biscogniauxia marginata]|nr:hypothetical protein F5X99DRAFT_38085 [Biscogniauxia marginata]